MLHPMKSTTQPKPTLHLLVTRYGDPILFVREQDANKVHISGAERSCGQRWATGEFTSEEARELWDTVIREGGRMADPSIAAKFLTLLDLLTNQLMDKVDNLTHELKESRTTNELLCDSLAACRDKQDALEVEFESTLNRAVEDKVNIVLKTLLDRDGQPFDKNIDF